LQDLVRAAQLQLDAQTLRSLTEASAPA
jgi:hypothetical protein